MGDGGRPTDHCFQGLYRNGRMSAIGSDGLNAEDESCLDRSILLRVRVAVHEGANKFVREKCFHRV